MKTLTFAKAALFGLSMALAQPAFAAKMKLAHDSPSNMEKSGSYTWGHTFANYLNEHGMEVEEFQRGALGGEAERMDQVSQGLLEVSMSAVKVVGSLDKLIFGVYLPYFFESSEQLNKALFEGGIVDSINARITKKGVRLLGFYHLGLPAGLFNTKKEIKTVADMPGMRFRALDEFQIALFQSWGATGTIVSWAEVPNALQTGIADGYINPPFVPLLFGHTEFLKYFTDSKTTQSLRLIIVSEDWYSGLSDDQRKIVADAVEVANKANLAWVKKQSGIIKALEKAGLKVTTLTPEALAEFRKKAEAVYTSGPLNAEQLAQWIAARDK